MNFAELLHLRGGDDSAVVTVLAVFPELNREQRDAGAGLLQAYKQIAGERDG
jgi:hypothetical protein